MVGGPEQIGTRKASDSIKMALIRNMCRMGYNWSKSKASRMVAITCNTCNAKGALAYSSYEVQEKKGGETQADGTILTAFEVRKKTFSNFLNIKYDVNADRR